MKRLTFSQMNGIRWASADWYLAIQAIQERATLACEDQDTHASHIAYRTRESCVANFRAMKGTK